jgi:predicted Zn-dependent peptidase
MPARGALAAESAGAELPRYPPRRGWAVSWLLPLLLIALPSQGRCGLESPLLLPGLSGPAAGRGLPTRTQFDNGLRVVCAENPATQTIALSAFITTSALAEVASTAGMRGFVARALVDCSANDQPAISAALHELGAEAYVGAGIDFTEITLLAAAEDVESGAALLRQILLDGEFKPDSINRLRRELAANLARADELPETAAENAAAARLYPNHPFGWPPDGLAASVSGITIEHVRRFYEGSYLPNNMVIVAAGGVPAERALEAIAAVFRSALPGNCLPETQTQPLPVRTGPDELERPGGSAVVYIGARAPGVSDPGYAPTTVALSIMGSGLHSRLYQSLRREKAIAYTIDARAMTARMGARAGLLVSCPPGMLAEAERRMLREMRRVATEPPSPEEIRRATEYICTSYALNHQRSADLAHQLGAFEVTADRGYALDAALPGLVRETTPEAVMEAARGMFSRTVTIRVLPS